ncbi:MAG: hypothetical protein JKY15_00205 [Deltaproteobacteria bacterium]|nr:hypothetical protein [Deltaproteobacteria bacterium]
MLKKSSCSGNLYAEQDLIQAYRVLYDQTPLVKFCHEQVNCFLNEATKNHAAYTLLDIGFGTGAQWISYLEQHPQQQIDLIGIDLPTPLNQKLVDEFKQKTAHLSNFRFQSILQEIEQLAFAKLPIEIRPLYINASLALHHLWDKDWVLSQIKLLKPELFCLVEPDSDHNSQDPDRTLSEVKAHYGALFEFLEHHLAGKPELAVIQDQFFGEEIRNILGFSDRRRVERCERFEQWTKRLNAQSFKLLRHEGLTWKETRLVVCSAWAPSNSSAIQISQHKIHAA